MFFKPFQGFPPSLAGGLGMILLQSAVMLGKVMLIICLTITLRWTVPRFRFDQVMQLGWKFMLPVLLVYILILGATVLVLDRIGWSTGLRYGLVLFAANAVMGYVVFFLLDRDRLMLGRTGREMRA